jgi:hypothetical protein
MMCIRPRWGDGQYKYERFNDADGRDRSQSRSLQCAVYPTFITNALKLVLKLGKFPQPDEHVQRQQTPN